MFPKRTVEARWFIPCGLVFVEIGPRTPRFVQAGRVFERLVCGHVLPSGDPPARWRRCWMCPAKEASKVVGRRAA
jgi:hypothetical protein